jgi:hypothetical protein
MASETPARNVVLVVQNPTLSLEGDAEAAAAA